MPAYFLDSSAIAKRYFTESGSAWIKQLLHPAQRHEFYISAITAVEVIAAISRQRERLDGDFQAMLNLMRQDLQVLYNRIPVDDLIIENGMLLAVQRRLRGYDAVQLASASQLKEQGRQAGLSISFVSADVELNAAAAAEGLAVENPNDHP